MLVLYWLADAAISSFWRLLLEDVWKYYKIGPQRGGSLKGVPPFMDRIRKVVLDRHIVKMAQSQTEIQWGSIYGDIIEFVLDIIVIALHLHMSNVRFNLNAKIAMSEGDSVRCN